MSYPSYPNYKSTHVEWLKEVPKHWSLKPLWVLFRRIKDTGHPHEELLSVYREFGVIPKSSRDDNYNKPSEDLSGYQLVQKGDLAINKMKAWQGSVAISEYRGIVSPAYYVYRRQHRERSRFLHHLFRSKEYTSAYLSHSKGIRVNQWDLDPQEHSRMDVLLPPLDEQTQIARFLDHQTARIDALIAEQQRLIELLKEKRQAVISHAVTKGLDPDVAMKDSGVEWLGEVPAHWKRVGLKHVVYRIIDTEHKTAPVYEDGNYMLVRTSNVRKGKLVFTDTKYTDLEGFLEWTKRGTPETGDILFTREAPAGEACLVPKGIDLCLGQRMVLFKLQKRRVLPEFVMYSLYAGLSEEFVKSLSQGSTVAHFNMRDISNIPLFEPPLGEQKEIAQYIGRKLESFDKLINEADRSVSLMQERRSALISAAVTGKIDVRDWEPPVSKTFPQSTASEEAPA